MVEFARNDDELADFLAHYGVKGMKWGVRRAEKREAKLNQQRAEAKTQETVFTRDCKNGTKLIVTRKTKPSSAGGWLDKKIEQYNLANPDESSLSHAFVLRDKTGAKIGDASFYQESKTDPLDLEWIGVKRAHRRNGYARAALNGVIDYAADQGISELRMSATKMGAPLYEDLGFVKEKDGMHHMYLGDKVKHIKSNDDAKTLADYIVSRIDDNPDIDDEDEEVVMSDSNNIDDFLAHYGVKGMKWGRRRSEAELERAEAKRESASEDSSKAKVQKGRAKTSGTDALSNQELQAVITRMNLEQQYAKLNPPPPQSPAVKLVKELVGNAAKQQVQNAVNKAVAKGLEQAMKSLKD